MSHTEIDNLITKIEQQNKDFKEYVTADMEWKKSVTPSIEIMKNIENFSKGTIWLLKAVIVVGGAFGVVYGFIKYLKN
jgi:hypothetical protein